MVVDSVADASRVLVTRHGKPAAIIIGVEGEDIADLMTRSERHGEGPRRRSLPMRCAAAS
jgi:hypothetical protein